MKVWVNGRDRTADIGEAICESALAREKRGPVPNKISPDLSAMMLRNAQDDVEYRREFLRLLRYRDNVDTLDFSIPRKPGLLGALSARFKSLLWRMLRYQHDRISFRQNLINNCYTGLFEMEIQQRDKEIAGLRSRIGLMESRLQAEGDRS